MKTGVSSDSQFLVNAAKNHMAQFAIEFGDIPPVKVCARILQQYQYQYKKYLNSTILLVGYDNMEGPCIYAATHGGSIFKECYASNGSGSTYVKGYLDKNYKPNMTRQEAKDLLKSAVALAIFRDGSSGGCIRMVDINRDGVTREYYAGGDIPYPKSYN